MESKTMNVEQAIEYLYDKYGIKRSKRSIYQMVQNNELDYIRFRKQILFEPENIDVWVSENMGIRKQA